VIVRYGIPLSAILLPAAFFFSILKANATEPNAVIYLAYVGAFILAISLIILGIGLVRKKE
jgi:predicted permease